MWDKLHDDLVHGGAPQPRFTVAPCFRHVPALAQLAGGRALPSWAAAANRASPRAIVEWTEVWSSSPTAGISARGSPGPAEGRTTMENPERHAFWRGYKDYRTYLLQKRLCLPHAFD